MNLNSFGSRFWIEVSTDQGANWRRLIAVETASNWYDDASEVAFVSNTFAWITASNTLSFTARERDVRLRFVFEGAAGENEGQKLAIDDINILPNFSTATNQLNVVNDFRLFPNPSNRLVKLELDLGKTTQVEYQIVDIPSGDELLHVLYELEQRTQIPGRRHLYSNGSGVDVHMPHSPPQWRGIYDEHQRLMVAINFNMDIGDAWEHADDPVYPLAMTSLAYRFGINYLIYAMTH